MSPVESPIESPIESTIDFGAIIYRSADSSYVINNGMFHVPNPSSNLPEFYDLWNEVDAYAKANPQMVTVENPPPEPTPEEIAEELKAEFEFAVTAHLDDFARQWHGSPLRQWDSMDRARLAYLTEDFKEDGAIANQAYNDTWAYIDNNGLMEKVGSGELTLEQAMSMLPALTWSES